MHVIEKRLKRNHKNTHTAAVCFQSYVPHLKYRLKTKSSNLLLHQDQIFKEAIRLQTIRYGIPVMEINKLINNLH